MLITAGAFTLLLGLVVDGGRLIDARLAAAHAAGQAARAGADSLSAASVRNGHDAVAVGTATARAEHYLRDADLNGVVHVEGETVSVTVTGQSHTRILSILGIDSFPIRETETARGVSEEASP